MPRKPALRNICHGPRTSIMQLAVHPTPISSCRTSHQSATARVEELGKGETTSRLTTTRATPEYSPPKPACAGDAVLRTSTQGTVPMGHCAGCRRRGPQFTVCPFLQMTYTVENPHADGNAAPGGRPRSCLSVLRAWASHYQSQPPGRILWTPRKSCHPCFK
jgi:hypothetical protein